MLSSIPLNWYLILSAILFALGDRRLSSIAVT